MTAEGDAMKSERIEITQYWDEKLKEMPYLSCKWLLFYSFSYLLFETQKRTARPSIYSRPTQSHLRLAASAKRFHCWELSGSIQSQRRSRFPLPTKVDHRKFKVRLDRPHKLVKSWPHFHKVKMKRPRTLICRYQESEMKYLKVILIHLRSLFT